MTEATPGDSVVSAEQGSDHFEDGTMLGSLEDVVDSVLGEDLVPPEPESPWERRQRVLDSWTAIILAVAAVCAAWASFQAS